jgi:hypothetical protein
MTIGRIPGATGIQPTIVDAKGDIIAATAADSVTRLAVGTNDQVLTADSATATGLKWATPVTGSFTLLSTTTLTSTSNVISGISGSYTHLYIEFRDVFASGGSTAIRIRVNNAVSKTYLQADTDGRLNSASTANKAVKGFLYLYSYTDTSNYKPAFYSSWTGTNTTTFAALQGGEAFYVETTAVSSVAFEASFNLSGTVLIYGVK